MIPDIDSLNSYSENLERTNMLITAMEKIKAYNRIYQEKTYTQNIDLGKIVEEVQLEELLKIERSCSEHAIISLTTLIEIFYKELLQELLCQFPNYFLAIDTNYTSIIKKLIFDSSKHDFDSIAEKLKLKNRYNYFKFFRSYNLIFLLDEEHDFIDYIYILRNCFVHNGGKIDRTTENKMKKAPNPDKEISLSTKAKRLRTRIKRLVPKVHERVSRQLLSFEAKGV